MNANEIEKFKNGIEIIHHSLSKFYDESHADKTKQHYCEVLSRIEKGTATTRDYEIARQVIATT